MKFKLNLASRLYINRRALHLGFGAVIGLLLVMLSLNLMNTVFLQGHIKQLKTYLKTYPAPETLAGGTPANLGRPLEKVVEDIRFANDILEKRRFYWTGFLDQLEGLAADKIKIRAIQPNFSERTVRMSGLAANLRDLQQFLEKLSADASFSDYFLLEQGQTSLKEEGRMPREAVAFTVLVKGVI
ncbi:MAG: hypothetical protein JXK94_12535 [Deltaproteobacteria bacterium]|nr:hypothetical protein [Deltaproteobacteria bacterium]